MEHTIDCEWKEEMSFAATVNDHVITLDADSNFGGKDRGPRPKPLLLVSLAGCTGMDVISILSKMKITPEHFSVKVRAHLTEDHPKYYDKIMLIYEFKGNDLPESKLRRAIELSQEKYCGVSALLRKGCELAYELKILPL